MFDGRVYVNPSSKGMINLYPGNVNVTEAAVQAAGYLNVVQANITANGYIKEVSGSDVAPFVPADGMTTGSSNTYFCDYYYQNGAGVRIARVGGHWVNGADAGPFALALYSAPSVAGGNYGARLRMISAT